MSENDRNIRFDLPSPDLSTTVITDGSSAPFISLSSLDQHGSIEIRSRPSTATVTTPGGRSANARRSIEEQDHNRTLQELSASFTAYSQVIPRPELAVSTPNDAGDVLSHRYELPPAPSNSVPQRHGSRNSYEGGSFFRQTSHVRNGSDSSEGHSPDEEASPLGSPERKFEEFVPNSGYHPERARFRDRPYKRNDLFDVSTYDGRLATYFDWTHSFLDKEVLAEAGFFSTGVADEVRCSKCGGGIDNWEQGDDPKKEHFKHFGRICF